MIRKSTLQLLRFHFSIFLMPVYWFALTQLVNINWVHAAFIFFILHVLVYPSSNGYNSYMDRDTSPIGGLANPLQPTKQLFYVTVIMDVVAIALSFFISAWLALGMLIYIIGSRLYSYRGIRLKQYPIIGYLTVITLQGGLVYWMVYHGSSAVLKTGMPIAAMIAASLLIGGFYPLTQIYQHKQDKEDAVTTISYLLGYRRTFIFCAIIYSVAMLFVGYTFISSLMIKEFFILAIFFLPILVYFLWWAGKVWREESFADFKHTMQMNVLASVCTNAAFITILIMNQFE
ncbi:MAG TPA: UbiA family prenyltransferase [Lacibacter sp.]|jgi:1,4-dihydroxy-2-naphthoate polyprenyltransferase|nr:UbiA family prenyltransferase [Lacibacter sp.]